MNKTVRIKDIAQKAGVSIGTVDRVLHNRGEVKAETREKVMKIAKSLNYQPNIAARALKSPIVYKIAVIIPACHDSNQFWQQHPMGISLAQESTSPFITRVKYFYFEMHNPADFMQKASELIDWKPDGAILAPILKNESIELCHRLDDLEIPYSFIDTFLNDTNALTFVGENAYKGGRVAASLMDMGVQPDKDILIINLAKDLDNVQHLNLRNQGFLSYFLDAGKNTGLKISVEIPHTDKKTVNEILDRVFKNNPNIGGVMVSSSRTYVIAEYIQKHQLQHLFLIGYETFEKNSAFMKDGVIDFLISQRPIEQAEKAFKLLFNYLVHNTTPDKTEYQPIDIINAENIDLL